MGGWHGRKTDMTIPIGFNKKVEQLKANEISYSEFIRWCIRQMTGPDIQEVVNPVRELPK